MIEKLKMQTPNITEQNMEQIAKLFPNVMTETQDENGNNKRAIDFDLLKQSLSSVLVDDADERYRLDWPGKKAALLKANTPITKTLRPCRDDSVNFDSTENVYIEGDNFEVLKILQESYLGKIKMIYIDPPYNTGKDFIYKDNFTAKKTDYEEELGTTDEEDNKLFKNTDTNGRFHSDWLSMMYERLIVARDLLKEDGVIFISIDDNELCNVEKLCDEIFGEPNKIGIISRATGTRMGTGSRGIARELDYIIVFSKSGGSSLYKLPMNEDELKIYNEEDEHGKYLVRSLRRTGGENRREDRPSMFYPVFSPDGDEVFPISPDGWESRWVCGKKTYEKMLEEGFIVWKQVKKGKDLVWQVYQKHYIGDGRESSDLWGSVAGNKKATKEVNEIFDNRKIFDHPKPIDVIQKVIRLATKQDDDSFILDFFSGSATTAHAVMQLNAEDNGNRKFIMVQIPEATDEKSEAYKAGYKTIAEIGKERIRRAGNKIVEDNQDKAGIDTLDIGFRVYKTDSSNMKEVYYHPEQLTQDDIFSLESNIKKGREPDDLLTQVILDLGLELNLPIEQKEMHGNNVFIVQTNALVACFDDNINTKIIDKIAQLKPFKVVFKDASFAASKDRINLEERFKRLSPETLITVI